MFFPIKATILDGQPTAEVSGQVQQPLSQPQTQQARQRKKHTAQRWMADFMMMGDDEQVALGFTETWYLCMCIYIYTSSIPCQVRFARRWHEKELSRQKNRLYLYLYIFTPFICIYTLYYIHSQLNKTTNFARNLGTLLDWIVLFGCRFQILQLYNCFMVSLKGNKSTAPNQEHR